MKSTRSFTPAALAAALLAALVLPARGHKHLDTGAEAPTVGSKLFFRNGAGYEAASGFLYRLTPTNLASGLVFRSGDISRADPDVDNDPVFTCLPVDPNNGGPEPFAPLLGARVALQIVGVSGPDAGALSFWNSDGDYIAEDITFTVPVGTTHGTNAFFLSENDGSPGSDPYGHIHGRRFSVDLPGLYTVDLRLVDATTNGPGHGPLHAPSALFKMYFQAGTSIVELVPSPVGNNLTFGTETGRTYSVESTGELGPAGQWTSVGDPIVGNGKLQTVEGLPASIGPVFYRLRITIP
jgi:hypothetical protein